MKHEELVMKEHIFNSFQAWNAYYIFLRSLWNLDPNRFAARGIGLGAFLNFSNFEFEDDYEWRRECARVLQKSYTQDEKLNSEEILKIAQGMIEK
jgi:coproporphyrinogen III oxidase